MNASPTWRLPADRRAAQWCILRTSPGRTIALAEWLEKAGFEVWTPVRTIRKRRPRSKEVTKYAAPIMPTFVFARADRLHDLAQLSALPPSDRPQFSIFRHGGRIPLVADREVAGARIEEAKARDEEERASKREHRHVFPTGAKVKVNSDAFTGLEGIVEDGGDGRNALVAFGGSIVISISTYLLTSDDLDAGLPRAAYALQIVETFADHVVGTGIVGAPTGLKGRNAKKVSADWRSWSEDCDHDDDQDLNGLIWSAAKGMGESGASIMRFHRQPFDASTTIAPLKLQLLEPDFIDLVKTGTTAGGGWIDRGIEYDAAGRKVAYWLLPAHPGDVASWRARGMVSERVPADEVVYLYNKLRPGQDRGMPILAPAIMTLQDLRSYFSAELVRKRTAACMVGVITTQDEDLKIGIDPDTKRAKSYGPQKQKFEPGMFTRLLPGEDIEFNSPPNDPGVDMMATQYLREAAAAAGVMYEHATGDFSRVNYSSWRAGHHGFRRRMERIQWLVVIHKLCRVIAQRYREAARAADLLPAQNFGWRWTPPGFISVDPYKDAQADLANLRMGKVTLSQLVEERGYDYLEFLAQYAEDLASAEAALGAGVMFDGDPRKVMNPGTPAKTDKADPAANDTAGADAAA